MQLQYSRAEVKCMYSSSVNSGAYGFDKTKILLYTETHFRNLSKVDKFFKQ